MAFDRLPALVCAIFVSAPAVAPAAAPSRPPATDVRAPAGLAPIVPSWSFGLLGEWIGTAGLVVANGASGPELYASGREYFFDAVNVWYVLRYRGDQARFEQTFTSEAFSSSIIGLAVADVVGD